MENIIYQISDTYSVSAENTNTLKFYCQQTNECNPDYEIRQLGAVLTDDKGVQIDFSFDQRDLNSLIKYLTDLRDYSEQFNEKSKNSEQYHLPSDVKIILDKPLQS